MELRIDLGPGYRVYFARPAPGIVLLLCGGDKRGQHDDIERAQQAWAAYLRARTKDADSP